MHDENSAVFTPPASHAPLILGTLAHARRRDLSAALGGSGTVWREVDAPGASDDAHCGARRGGDLSAAIDQALSDPRDAREQVVDAVVERLLKELSW